ncbi:uncharacterized protein G2W53_010360 [Senna tora]|uniref:Uncharacterized protein n=1 Tax=Senna tora TaxID=362788 RepID=A0A835CB96_9FABA|nr:uncharacterized protein G2W53_010360 [Senna tora]
MFRRRFVPLSPIFLEELNGGEVTEDMVHSGGELFNLKIFEEDGDSSVQFDLNPERV